MVCVALNMHCRLNVLFYMIKCRSNAAITHKPEHDLHKLPKKKVHVALNTHCCLNALF